MEFIYLVKDVNLLEGYNYSDGYTIASYIINKEGTRIKDIKSEKVFDIDVNNKQESIENILSAEYGRKMKSFTRLDSLLRILFPADVKYLIKDGSMCFIRSHAEKYWEIGRNSLLEGIEKQEKIVNKEYRKVMKEHNKQNKHNSKQVNEEKNYEVGNF